jgi:hypothetical protein
MNPLREYFENNPGRLIHKWVHYFDIYHRHFSRFRHQPVTVVEFGVFHGGSLQMWRHYFGPEARIIGIDFNPACRSLEEDQIEIHIGNQEDEAFLTRLCSEIGQFHILIDDGGHTMGQQITTFEMMFPALAADGAYLVEDLHTSYWPEYGGGYSRPTSRAFKGPRTFVEYSKNLIDALHAWHAPDQDLLPVSDFTRSAVSMHYYDSVLVIEKGAVTRPYSKTTGVPSLPTRLRRTAQGSDR